MSALPLERRFAEERAVESADRPGFLTAFHAAATAVVEGREPELWRQVQRGPAHAVAGHIEGVAAVRSRHAPRQAFAEHTAAWWTWPVREPRAAAA